MNKTNRKNYFLKNINNNLSNSHDELLKFAIKQAGNPEITTILYITNKDYEKSIVENFDDNLNKITFIHFKTIDQIITKLLDFHSWVKSPNLIILEFDNISNDDDNIHNLIELNHEIIRKFCFLISCLINYSYYLNKNNNCITITYLEENHFNKNVVDKLIELYFYKTFYTNLKDLMEEFKN